MSAADEESSCLKSSLCIYSTRPQTQKEQESQ